MTYLFWREEWCIMAPENNAPRKKTRNLWKHRRLKNREILFSKSESEQASAYYKFFIMFHSNFEENKILLFFLYISISDRIIVLFAAYECERGEIREYRCIMGAYELFNKYSRLFRFPL